MDACRAHMQGPFVTADMGNFPTCLLFSIHPLFCNQLFFFFSLPSISHTSRQTEKYPAREALHLQQITDFRLEMTLRQTKLVTEYIRQASLPQGFCACLWDYRTFFSFYFYFLSSPFFSLYASWLASKPQDKIHVVIRSKVRIVDQQSWAF